MGQKVHWIRHWLSLGPPPLIFSQLLSDDIMLKQSSLSFTSSYDVKTLYEAAKSLADICLQCTCKI